MKRRSFMVSFVSLLLTTGVLFLIGHLSTIPWFMFRHEYTDNENGFIISTGSWIPLIIGLIVSFFAEKMYIAKHRQNLVHNTRSLSVLIFSTAVKFILFQDTFL